MIRFRFIRATTHLQKLLDVYEELSGIPSVKDARIIRHQDEQDLVKKLQKQASIVESPNVRKTTTYNVRS